MSVNGLFEDGNCSLLATTTCNEPTTSVLFDGITPTLTGLDGDMWASQLLTLYTDSLIPDITDITFDFEATPGYVGVERVEVVMFNCPEWGISVDSIILYQRHQLEMFLHRQSNSHHGPSVLRGSLEFQ